MTWQVNRGKIVYSVSCIFVVFLGHLEEDREQCDSEQRVNQTATMEESKLKLYSSWRSSSSSRVRIALNLKGLKYEYKAVNLLKGEQFSPEFSKLSPLNYVPTLVDGDMVVVESFAILMYLEDKYPQHPLLPPDLKKRAINYQAASFVSSSIQPLQNLVEQKYIAEEVGSDEKLSWVKHHMEKGLAALEKLLKDHAAKYASGDEVFLADLFLAPQIHDALTRFNVDMTQFPLLLRLNDAYNELPAFQDAMPEKQPDYLQS
ncbi:glutathione S-transferase zeta class-like isoform X1 [Vitis riparia]|uniref:glutathione S-transferase zeta class-like isoform X1 n=1 Tax=Vitis riparia TaxID=96939 RepID=UPI00155B3857|nr:glutathione S-transferase zeta class-like isoform X1 [Vitis riparia]